MIDKTLRGLGAASLAALALATSMPAAALTMPLDGTIYLAGGGAAPGGRCAPDLTIFNTNIGTTNSNHGVFIFNSSECIKPPPPTTTYDGMFSFQFATGSLEGTTFSVLTDSGTPGVFNLDGLFVVTGGTGSFAGATGELRKRGILDRREFPPNATALIGFVGTVSLVPEPASYGLMLSGLGLLALGLRRRRAGAAAGPETTAG
ncbi:PEP-CTERM sorting domain-containing protein [Roseateles violae]|uniref:PEP-CTERM sorting domain-containing protein n=1 Tax=Roseateles violae TaxID=3058042 RepID=A0ABT8DL51_9BURK|nr:PEP-CTERM sorting domain-containing protein [Pelomonas sp. PFR6]MDN3919135.1 PEP-CTERM sorting domain-containing protein [Pelomonas sp. PFR6]